MNSFTVYNLQLIHSILLELIQNETFVSNTILVFLNGLIHTDDRLALKSTTKQMKLEKEIEGKTFSCFSENLSFLLSCLKTGKFNFTILLINFK